MIKYFIYSLFSGLFFFLSWPTICSFFIFFIFFSFVPLFLIEQDLYRKNRSVFWIFLFSFIAFFIFNFSTTFWIEKASSNFGEGLFAVSCNSLFMAITFLLYSIFHRLALYYFDFNWIRKQILGLFILSVFWLGFESLHMTWDLNWPWLTLGNVFADHPSWVQWYSYTGVFGGTIWVLLLNYIFFQTYLNFPYRNKLNIKDHLFYLSFFIIPFFVSKIIYYTFQHKGKSVNVLVAQPNIDPNDRYPNDRYFNVDKDRFDSLTNNQLNDSIDYVVFPESFFYNESSMVFTLKNIINDDRTSNINFIVGTTIYKNDMSHYMSQPKQYNTAIQINKKGRSYHYKSKLVPGPELTPFFSYLQPFLDFTGLSLGLGGLSKGDSINVFYSCDSRYCVAPIICYESIFPNYVRKFINKGAQAIFIITNDGWWENSKGRKQHNAYARIRAIETRRYVVRSANTGISSVINPKGDFESMLESNKKGSIVQAIDFLSNKTFYVKYGNLLIFIYLASFIFLVPNFKVLSGKTKFNN